MSDAIRVGIVHRSRLFRDCLAAAVSKWDRFESQALEHPSELDLGVGEPRADVVLIDLNLPGRQAREWTRAVYGAAQGSNHDSQACEEAGPSGRPKAKVMVLASGEVNDSLFECMAAGAHGCVLENSSIEHLRKAIERVHRGETFHSPAIVQSLFRRVTQSGHAAPAAARTQPAELTPREKEIVRCIAERLSNKQIARRLELSLHTVKNHVHNIVDKLQVRSRHEAVEYARQRNWLEEPEPTLS